MLLTASNILRPVTSVSFFVVKKTSDTKLFCGCAVAASPIPWAGCLVTEDAIQPVAVFGTDGGICQIFPPTNGRIPPRIVTSVGDPSVFSHPDKSVGTIVELSLSRQTLPIPVAVGDIGDYL